MKKILLGMLLSASFICTMEETHNKQLKHSREYSRNTLSHATLMELYSFANESSSPDETLQKIREEVLAMVQSQAAFKPPLEIALYIINSIDFSTPIEFLKFLTKFSSLNKHFRAILKPHIIDLVSSKFNLDKESVKEFLELVFGRSGIPLEYLQELLINKDKREKIKLLRASFESDPWDAIEKLRLSVHQLGGTGNYIATYLFHGDVRKEAADIIMSLSKKIFYFDMGSIITGLIDINCHELLKMLIGAGININAKNIKLENAISIEDKCLFKCAPLMYAVYHNKFKMAELFLKAGANVDIEAIDFAIKNKNQELFDWLISYDENQKK